MIWVKHLQVSNQRMHIWHIQPDSHTRWDEHGVIVSATMYIDRRRAWMFLYQEIRLSQRSGISNFDHISQLTVITGVTPIMSSLGDFYNKGRNGNTVSFTVVFTAVSLSDKGFNWLWYPYPEALSPHTTNANPFECTLFVFCILNSFHNIPYVSF